MPPKRKLGNELELLAEKKHKPVTFDEILEAYAACHSTKTASVARIFYDLVTCMPFDLIALALSYIEPDHFKCLQDMHAGLPVHIEHLGRILTGLVMACAESNTGDDRIEHFSVWWDCYATSHDSENYTRFWEPYYDRMWAAADEELESPITRLGQISPTPYAAILGKSIRSCFGFYFVSSVYAVWKGRVILETCWKTLEDLDIEQMQTYYGCLDWKNPMDPAYFTDKIMQ
jgi:hypothetical protein